MEQILTQEEIDALLESLKEGKIPEVKEDVVTREEERPGVEKFSFFRQGRGVRQNLPALHFIFDRFSKSLQKSLSVFLEQEVELEAKPIIYQKYEEFVRNLPLPTNMNIIVTEKLNGFYITVFDAKMVFAILEVMFGAKRVTNPKVEGREFTKIELSVIRKLVELVASEMEKAWEPVYGISCRYSRSEMNPAYVTLVAPEEVVCVSQIDVSLASVSGWMKICIPYSILEPIKDYLLSTPSREDADMRRRWFEKLLNSVNSIPLEVRTILTRREMALREFLELKPGSIFLTDKAPDEPVLVEVQGRAKFLARIGSYKGSKAVKIERIIQ